MSPLLFINTLLISTDHTFRFGVVKRVVECNLRILEN
jgi:hypothetical protein